MYCNKCGTAGDPKERRAGFFWIELLLWIQLLLWAVTASIVPTGDAIAGDYVITFTAASSQASQATATADLRFTVETSTLWAIVGIAVIVLTLLALGWVFRTYGRR